MKFIFLVACAALVSCSSVPREPSSSSEGLKDRIQRKMLDATAGFSDENCGRRLRNLQDSLKDINWTAYSNSELKKDSVMTIRAMWATRSLLHKKLGEVGRECALAMRDTFHIMRDTEDYLGEFAYDVPAYNPASLKFQEQPVPILDYKAYPRYFVSESADADNFKFKSGDLMIARGVSFISAIISQVSDNRSQFSHVVFVNVDEKTKKANTIESYIGVGVSRYEMNYALKNENARLLLLRPKNSALGVKAAEILNKKVSEGNGRGGAIPYDYTMDFKDHSRMSCAEVATAGYRWASDGKIVLPTYSAQITLNNDRFLNDLSLKRGAIFTPDDLEIDPNFEMVVDWRDPRLIRDSRYKDAILAEMIRWVGSLNYQFHDTMKSFMAKYLILPSRKTPVWGLVKQVTGAPNLDREIPKKSLGVMTVLGQIGDALLERVEQEDKNYIASHGRPMTNEQLRDFLESVRAQDLSSYENRKGTLIHYALRPAGVKQKSKPFGPPHRR